MVDTITLKTSSWWFPTLLKPCKKTLHGFPKISGTEQEDGIWLNFCGKYISFCQPVQYRFVNDAELVLKLFLDETQK